MSDRDMPHSPDPVYRLAGDPRPRPHTREWKDLVADINDPVWSNSHLPELVDDRPPRCLALRLVV